MRRITPDPTRPGASERDRDVRLGRRCRRFNLLDGMIVVAASAVAIVGCRAEDALYSEWYYRVQMFVEFFLILGSGLVLVFRLRGPRPPFRLLARQPGAVACFAVVAFKVVQVADLLLDDISNGELGGLSGFGPAIWYFLSDSDHTSAAVVPICWALLAVNRRWRPEPGWIDRSGRVLGWAWIAWMVAAPVFLRIAGRYDVLNGPFRSIM